MLTLANVSKFYGVRELFSDISLFISRNDRLGLVGANGVGKSTLFRLILGEEKPDSGLIEWERGADYGFLPQESAPVGNETILQLATNHAQLSPTETNWDIDYTLEPRARKILAGLGFKDADADQAANSFSGGWVMRAHLARLLVMEPSLLLLDEPTNHLDLESLLWLQDYLTRYPGGLVVISHDRAFLNALCTGMLELRSGSLHYYHGNYDNFLTERVARHEQQAALHKNQQREIAHLQKFVERFGAKASLASQAKSKEKQIARLKEEAVDSPDEDLRRIQFRFPQPPRSGLKVITLQQVRQAYGQHTVYSNLNFEARRGQRIVLVGPNGAGKSTLLKILAGVVPIQSGTRELGANVTAGYFAQNRTDTLDPKANALESLMSLRTAENDLTEQRARTILGAFLFRKDDVFKKIAVLSGGEKSRLNLARLLVDPPNLLLMDEPTTHLDIASIDALIFALRQYEGTLVFISHDVHFIRSVAENVLHVHSGHLTHYAGNYDYYLDKSKAANARVALTAGLTDARPAHKEKANPIPTPQPAKSKDKSTPVTAPKLTHNQLQRLRNEVERLEKLIADLEIRQASLVAELEKPETYADKNRFHRLNNELASLVEEIERHTNAWEKAAEQLNATNAVAQ